MNNPKPIGIVDIFAGPGGLSEGFASVGSRDDRRFRIALSIEKDAAAIRTLRLRSAVHEMNSEEYEKYIELLNTHTEISEELIEKTLPEVWQKTEGVAQHHELSDANQSETERMLDRVRERDFSALGLIGGPPCQVYSLAGRSRNARNANYLGDDDHRHTLYTQYIHVLSYLKPDFFVMENVKGMLSSQHQSRHIFPLVREDLEGAGDGYRLFALAADSRTPGLLPHEMLPIDHKDFIVRMEEFGVPQKRHRIIILGIKKELADQMTQSEELELRLRPGLRATVAEAIGKLPAVRSGLSKGVDSPERWEGIIKQTIRDLMALEIEPDVRDEINSLDRSISQTGLASGRSSDGYSTPNLRSPFMNFIQNGRLTRLHHHTTRSHIDGDLSRYIFAAAFSLVRGVSPKARDFPIELAPNHKNWKSGHFNDRFRVQTWNDASSTVTSHISKDGHFYIHPDPAQARSLTVREAARLQTFPDDYIFLGNRTQQYHQVGNAVPPYLAMQIAELLSTHLSQLLHPSK